LQIGFFRDFNQFCICAKEEIAPEALRRRDLGDVAVCLACANVPFSGPSLSLCDASMRPRQTLSHFGKAPNADIRLERPLTQLPLGL